MKISCLVVLVFYFCFQLSGQCPDRTQLRNRILYLKNSSVDYRQQLNELLPVSSLLKKCPQKNDSVQMLLLQRIGSLQYLTGDFEHAVSSSNNVISLFQSPDNQYKDTSFILRVYYFLQIYYDSLRKVDEKMNAIDSSIHYALLSNTINDQILYNFWQLSSYTLERGDFERCIEYSSLGESLIRKFSFSSDSIGYINSFFTNRINAHIELGELQIAESDLQKKKSEFIAAGLETYCGPIYNLLSIVAARKNKYGEALDYQLNSLRINEKYGQKSFERETLSNIGFIYINYFGNATTGLKYFQQALNIKPDNEPGDSNGEIQSFNITGNIGYAFAQLNQFDSSDIYFKSAFDMLGYGMDENKLAAMPMNEFNLNPRLIYVTGIIRLKGGAYFMRYQVTRDVRFLDQSIRIYKAGDRILTKGKAGQMELQSQLSWRRGARQLYEQAINVCYVAHRPQEAFYFFERSRAVLLYDQISRNRSMTANDINTRSQIEARLTQLRSKLPTASDEKEYAEIQKSILFLTKQRDRIQTSPKGQQTPELTFDEFIKQRAPKDETLLEIFYGDSAVFVLGIAHQNAILKKIDKKIFDQLSLAFIEYVGDPLKSNSHFDRFVSVSNQLYRLLMDSISIDGRLIVSPDGNNFPFEALVTSPNTTRPTYLIKDRAVSYTYSAGFLLLDFSVSQRTAPPMILGMAPVNFPRGFNLASLQGSDESLARIVSTFNSSEAVLSSSATKARFLNEFYKYRIVQLYTHGMESGKAGVPVVYFADSALNLFDLIPANKPATQLVVLSACETGKGVYYQGEGVFSFNRAFAEAGIPTSMVNLWSVDNQSSYALTELFYKYLSKDLPLDEALRQAKIEFVTTSGKERSLPYYWAAAVLAGQPISIVEKPTFPWMGIAGIALILLSLVIIAFRYFSRRGPYR